MNIIKTTETQDLILETFHQFVDQEVKPRLKELNSVDEFPFWLRDRMVELGYTRIGLPESMGGLGEPLTTRLMLLEEGCKYNSLLGHFADLSGQITRFIETKPDQRILDAYLPRMIETGAFFGQAFTEANSGSDSRAIETTAVLDGDEWVINGTKTFCSYLGACLAYQITAVTVDENGNRGISCFIVDAKTPGLTEGGHYPKIGMPGTNTGDLHLENCRIPKYALLGVLNKGLHVSFSVLDDARLGISAKCLGFAQGALNMALAYSKERRQFGQRICDFQTIQNYLADSAMEIAAGRALVYNLAKHVENGEKVNAEASMAKLYCSEMAFRVSDRAMQICGGLGVCTEFGIDIFFRNARVARITDGTSEIQRKIISKSLLR